jgi:hypothetical protein
VGNTISSGPGPRDDPVPCADLPDPEHGSNDPEDRRDDPQRLADAAAATGIVRQDEPARHRRLDLAPPFEGEDRLVRFAVTRAGGLEPALEIVEARPPSAGHDVDGFVLEPFPTRRTR